MYVCRKQQQCRIGVPFSKNPFVTLQGFGVQSAGRVV